MLPTPCPNATPLSVVWRGWWCVLNVAAKQFYDAPNNTPARVNIKCSWLLSILYIHIYNGLRLILIKQMYTFFYIFMHKLVVESIIYSLPSATLTHTHAEISYYLFATSARLRLYYFSWPKKIQIICRVSTRTREMRLKLPQGRMSLSQVDMFT